MSLSFLKKLFANASLAGKLRAFTAVELIIALALAAAVTPPLAAALKNASRLYKISRDERIAMRRAETVAAVLRLPFFYCGLGIPTEPQEYKKAFGSKITAPFNWDGPVSVTTETSGGFGRLRVAYAFPEGTRTSEACYGSAGSASAQMARAPDADYFDMGLWDKSASVKNWTLFPDAYPERTPLTVTSMSGKTLRLRSRAAEEFHIPKGASLYLFRAMECWSDGEKFYTRDFRTAGSQPRVNGICAARFTLNDGKNLLELCLMVRGDDEGLSGEEIKNYGCPAEFLARWEGLPRPCALYAFRFLWHLPNASGGKL